MIFSVVEVQVVCVFNCFVVLAYLPYFAVEVLYNK